MDPSASASSSSTIITNETPPQNPESITTHEDSDTDDPSHGCSASGATSGTNNASISKSSDALAKALSSTLTTVIKEFDSKAQETLKSQDKLTFAIDRLTRELDQLLEDAPLPFILQHAAKISGVRKRVSSLNSILGSIQRRVDNIDRMISLGAIREKTPAESS